MKKNKERRAFSRVLAYLSWATAHRLLGEHATAYREVTAAKRLIEEFGGEDVKVVFYDREYHIQFTLCQYRERLNRYYTVDASHGYENDYHDTNKSHVNARISSAEFVRYCTLRRDYRNYQAFLENAESVLYAVLTPGEFADYCHNGGIDDIPYDVSIQLWRKVRDCLGDIVNEAVAYRKVVL